jgi:uncharacterized membrane protein
MLTVFNQSLWGDEAFSAILSMKSVRDIISIIIRDTSPPLFNLTEHFWYKIFGTGEMAIRLLVFIYLLIAVFFVYKIGAHLWDKKTGLIAASLTLLNTFLFAYGFEGRMYSLLLATVTASFYFFLKKNWPGYIIATTLALYSHHFAIFAVFVQGLWFLKELFWGNRKAAFSIFKSFIAIVILYSPWLIPLYSQTKMVSGGFWLAKPNLKDLGQLTIKYLSVSLILLALRDWSKKFGKSAILVLWFAVPILITWLVSQKFQSIFYDRYLLYTIPAAMLLAASQMRRVGVIILAIVVLTYLSADFVYFTHPAKIPFRDLASYVKQTEMKGDFLINEDTGNHKLWESKYYGIPAPIYNPTNIPLPYFVGTALMEKGDIVSVLPKDVGRLGVITYKNADQLKINGFKASEEKSFGGLNFIWMDKSK